MGIHAGVTGANHLLGPSLTIQVSCAALKTKDCVGRGGHGAYCVQAMKGNKMEHKRHVLLCGGNNFGRPIGGTVPR